MGNFGITQVQISLLEFGQRLPLLAIFAGDDPDGSVRRNVAAAFSKDTDPAAVVMDQVGESAVGSGVPDASAFDRE